MKHHPLKPKPFKQIFKSIIKYINRLQLHPRISIETNILYSFYPVYYIQLMNGQVQLLNTHQGIKTVVKTINTVWG